MSGSAASFSVNLVETSQPLLSASEKLCVRAQTGEACSSAKIKPGEQIRYTLQIKNTGEGEAQEVRVRSEYQAESLENLRIENNGEIEISEDGGIIDFAVGEIAAEETIELSYEATLKPNLSSNTVVVSTSEISALDLPNQTLSSQFPVVVPNNPFLEIEKTCVEQSSQISCKNANLLPGDTVDYVISVENVGDSPAFNVRITDDFDQNSLVSLAQVEPNPQAVSQPADTLTWALGTLEAEESQTIRYSFTLRPTLTEPTKIDNFVRVTADNLPDVTSEVSFENKVLIVEQTPRSGGQTIILLLLGLATGGGYYYYRKRKK